MIELPQAHARELDLLARDRMMDWQELADEAFSDLLKKHGRPTDLKTALREIGAEAGKHFSTDQVELEVVMQIVTMVRKVVTVLGVGQGGVHSEIFPCSHASPLLLLDRC